MVLNARAIFCLFVFFCWNAFSHTKKSTIGSLFATAVDIHPRPPKSTMRSPVVTVKEGVDMKKQTKTKIGVGSFVKAKVGELEKITREVRIRRMRKEVVGYVHIVAGKKKFLAQSEDGKKKEISSYPLVFLSLKEKIEMDEAISYSPEK